MKRILIAALVATAALVSACATTDDGSSQGGTAQSKSNSGTNFHYPNY
jgi:hypothetical protein